MQRSLRYESRRGSFKTGCLIAVGIVLVLLVGGGIFAAMQWKNWAAMGIKAGTEATVNESDLPAEQKQRIIASINKVADDFKSGAVTTDQMGKIMEEIAKGPLLPVGVVFAAEEKYLKPSGLTQEEKDAGKRTTQRFARAIFERKFSDEEVHKILEPVSQGNLTISNSGKPIDANRNFQLKDKVNDAELRDFLARAKAKADEKQIPDEEFQVNIADELDKAIKKATGK